MKTKLEIVTSIDLSKQLLELLGENKTLFTWFNSNYTGDKKIDSYSLSFSIEPRNLKREFPAYTSDELIDLLEGCEIEVNEKGYVARQYLSDYPGMVCEVEPQETIAEALGLLLIKTRKES